MEMRDLLLMPTVLALASCGPDTITSRCDNSSAAEDAFTEWMLASLVSPGSAQFSDLDVDRRSMCSFTVRGYVDSQNRMGALLRTDIDVHMNYDLGTNRWEFHDNTQLNALLRELEALESQE